MKRGLWIAGALFALAGCGDGATGTGTVAATLWGEEFIQDQIPASAVEDGWTIRYTKFLVSLGEMTVASSGGGAGGTISGYRVFDLHTLTGPTAFGRLSSVSAERMDRVSYRLNAADAQTALGNATQADLDAMRAGGYSVYVEGTAERMGRSVRFRWGFAQRVLYETCRSSDTEVGVAVPTDGTATAQITIHGDHLFYDDLQSPDARVRFDAIAGADANTDGEVTLDELAAVDLTTLPPTQYGAGSAPNVRSLRDFVSYLVATVGHFNGEGHCEERRE